MWRFFWTKRLRPSSFVRVGLIAYASLVAASILLPLGSSDRADIVNLGGLPAPLMAASLCWLASRHSISRRARLAWSTLGMAGLCAVIGQGIWAFYVVVLGVEVPTPSLADVVTFWAYPFAFIGLALLVPQGSGNRLRVATATTMLDALTIAMAAAGVLWVSLLAPSLARAADPVLAFVNVSWPIGDLLLIFSIVSSVLRWPARRVPSPILLLLAGQVSQVVADIIFSFQVLDGTYRSGSLIDVIWTLAMVLNGLGALAWLRLSPAEQKNPEESELDLRDSWTQVFRMVLPYLSIPLLGLMTYLDYLGGDGEAHSVSTTVYIFAGAIVAVTMLRQFLTLVENRSLSRSLVKQSAEVARLGAATAINAAASRLSRCTSSSEALQSGLELACELTQLSSGALWATGSGDRLVMLLQRGTPDATGLLAESSDNVPAIRKVLASDKPLVVRTDGLAGRPAHVLAVPLMSRGNVQAVLALALEGGRTDCPPATIEIVQAIGAQLGVTMENTRRYEEARRLADHDPVTMLLNHRALHERLEQEVKRAHREDGNVALIMMDLDGFKLFNDTYGHPVGDKVLQDVARVLRLDTREYDVLARYGGDEFAAVLPDTDASTAVAVAQRIRSGLLASPYFAPDSSRVPIRMSFGIAVYPEDAREAQQLVVVADANLYESKHQGGDSITGGEPGKRDEGHRTGSFGVLDGLVTAVDHKDHYTRQHSEDVTNYAMALARQMGLSEDSQRTLRIAGLLHDVGKIGVPDRILRKPGRLEPEEFQAVRQHATLGEMIIKEVPNLQEVLAAVGSHHERFDGQGYPRGLSNDDIPLLGRILAIADTYSAMTTDRPYRKALTPDEAKSELLRTAGSQLDPDLVGVFVGLVGDGIETARLDANEHLLASSLA